MSGAPASAWVLRCFIHIVGLLLPAHHIGPGPGGLAEHLDVVARHLAGVQEGLSPSTLKATVPSDSNAQSRERECRCSCPIRPGAVRPPRCEQDQQCELNVLVHGSWNWLVQSTGGRAWAGQVKKPSPWGLLLSLNTQGCIPLLRTKPNRHAHQTGIEQESRTRPRDRGRVEAHMNKQQLDFQSRVLP